MVLQPVARAANATGSTFSCGYLVEDGTGRRAFLKALDYAGALRTENPAETLNALTAAFLFEVRVLERCRERRLSRVATPIATGKIPGKDDLGADVVEYLIFELAERDIRGALDAGRRFDTAWLMRALHHIATGLDQLHRIDIAHQDLKPSNVLVFSDPARRGADVSKLCDLGRAAYKGHSPPHDRKPVQGDPAYAPPELLYGQADPDWNRRRFGCDAYLLGSMVAFFFGGVTMTGALGSELRQEHHRHFWAGTYEDLLPFLRKAFGEVIVRLENDLAPEVREPLSCMIRELCEPDPSLRGHPRTRAMRGNPYALERYVSSLNLLATRAEGRLLRA